MFRKLIQQFLKPKLVETKAPLESWTFLDLKILSITALSKCASTTPTRTCSSSSWSTSSRWSRMSTPRRGSTGRRSHSSTTRPPSTWSPRSRWTSSPSLTSSQSSPRPLMSPLFKGSTNSTPPMKIIWSQNLTRVQPLESDTLLGSCSMILEAFWRKIETLQVMIFWWVQICVTVDWYCKFLFFTRCFYPLPRTNFSNISLTKILNYLAMKAAPEKLWRWHPSSRSLWTFWWPPWASVILFLLDVSSPMNSRNPRYNTMKNDWCDLRNDIPVLDIWPWVVLPPAEVLRYAGDDPHPKSRIPNQVEKNWRTSRTLVSSYYRFTFKEFVDRYRILVNGIHKVDRLFNT